MHIEFYRFLQFCIIGIVAIIFGYFHIAEYPANQWEDIFLSVGALPGCMFLSSYGVNEGAMYCLMIIIVFVIFLVTSFKKLVTEDRKSKELDLVEQQVKCPFSTEGIYILCLLK